MSAPLLWLAVLAAMALGTASCKDERLASSANGGTGGGGPAGSGGKAGSAGATPEVDAGPPIRSVEVRNPLGNTELSDNLFVDGDFELTSSGASSVGARSRQAARPRCCEKRAGSADPG